MKRKRRRGCKEIRREEIIRGRGEEGTYSASDRRDRNVLVYLSKREERKGYRGRGEILCKICMSEVHRDRKSKTLGKARQTRATQGDSRCLGWRGAAQVSSGDC